MAKRRKLKQNRFQKEPEQGLFSFDPIRQHLLKWGAIAGGAGGLLMIQTSIFWQIAGVFVVVMISNYHINRAARRIPRWHAVFASFAGVIVAMFGVIIVGTMILTYLQAPA